MSRDPVFGEECHNIPEAKMGDATLIETNRTKIRYWISDSLEKGLMNGTIKLKEETKNKILQKQSSTYKDLYTIRSYDLE